MSGRDFEGWIDRYEHSWRSAACSVSPGAEGGIVTIVT
jgi:hypothetical protein